MTESTTPEPTSEALAPPAPVATRHAAPAPSGQGGGDRSEGARKPLRNSAMADALQAATQGRALETRPAEASDQPQPQPPRSAGRRAAAPRPAADGARKGRGGKRPQPAAAPKAPPRPRHPVVEKLAGLYPALFGEQPLPLKRGIYQDLLAAHADAFDKAELKVALGLHTRSTRYLNAVSMGQPRHDLHGQVVEAMAPEHVFHALVEAFRRRKPRDGEDLQLKLRRRMGIAFMASGLSREAYLEKVQVRDEATQAMLDAALQEVAEFDAKAEALASAYAASGKSVAEFADMYGMHPGAVQRHLERAQQLKTLANASEKIA